MVLHSRKREIDRLLRHTHCTGMRILTRKAYSNNCPPLQPRHKRHNLKPPIQRIRMADHHRTVRYNLAPVLAVAHMHMCTHAHADGQVDPAGVRTGGCGRASSCPDAELVFRVEQAGLRGFSFDAEEGDGVVG